MAIFYLSCIDERPSLYPQTFFYIETIDGCDNYYVHIDLQKKYTQDVKPIVGEKYKSYKLL